MSITSQISPFLTSMGLSFNKVAIIICLQDAAALQAPPYQNIRHTVRQGSCCALNYSFFPIKSNISFEVIVRTPFACSIAKNFLKGNPMKVRLHKLLAAAGIASLRSAEKMIAAGRVTVNGEVVAQQGASANPDDIIAVDGKPIAITPNEKIYIMLHKPQGVVTTVTDPFNRPTVMDCVKEFSDGGKARLFPVGRLDFNTSGLLLLTNDGDWANALIHPKHEVRKTYIATIKGIPTEEALQSFRQGIKLDGRLTAPCEIESVHFEKKPFPKSSKPPVTKVSITIKEGRNRQVRKMCEAIGHPVITLKRVEVGGIQLGDLPRGKWRHLTQQEVKKCLEAK